MRRTRGAKGVGAILAILGSAFLTIALVSLWLGAAEAGAVPSGAAAPDFSGKTLDGQAVSVDTYHGQPLVLLFWGSW